LASPKRGSFPAFAVLAAIAIIVFVRPARISAYTHGERAKAS
jgi:MFS transporter, ACS family, inner membrane transport protein